MGQHETLQNSETSDAAVSEWQTLAEVPFAGDVYVAEAPVPHNAEKWLKPRSREEIGADLEAVSESAKIDDLEHFAETGELAPGDDPADAARIISLIDEMFTATQKDGGCRTIANEIADYANYLGGRYAEETIGGVTCAEAAQFCKRFPYVGYSYGFTAEDIKVFKKLEEDLASDYADEEAAENIDEKLIAETMYIKASRELASGEMSELSSGQLNILNSIPTERIAENPAITKAYIDKFTSSMRRAGENASGYIFSSEHPSFLAPIFSETMKTLLAKPNVADSLRITAEDVQAYGDFAIKADSSYLGIADRSALISRNITFLNGFGYNLFHSDENVDILRQRTEFQKQLDADGLIKPENVDQLYQSYIHDALSQGKIPYGNEIYDGLEPSGNDKAAVLWKKYSQDFSRIFNSFTDYPYSREERHRTGFLATKIGTDGMPTEEFKNDIAEYPDRFFGNGIEFIAKNRELFGNQMRTIYNNVFVNLNNFPEQSVLEFNSENLALINAYLDMFTDESVTDQSMISDFKNMMTAWTDTIDSEGNYKSKLFYQTLSPDQIRNSANVFASVNSARSILPYSIRYNISATTMAQDPKTSAAIAMEIGDFTTQNDLAGFSKKFPTLVPKLSEILLGEHIDGIPTPRQEAVLDTYLTLNNVSSTNYSAKANAFQRFVVEEIPNPDSGSMIPRYETLSVESITQASDILTRLFGSNSSTLSRLASNFAGGLLQKSPEEADHNIDNMEKVLLQRNVPDFAKLYFCANTLFEGDIRNERDISPVLKNAESSRTVIMTDALRTAIRSDNRSLREYLEHEIENEDISPADNTDAPSEDNVGKLHELDVVEEFVDSARFRTRFQTYAANLGFDSIRAVLDEMRNYRSERDRKHRESVEMQPDGSYRLREGLKPGDMVKGITTDFISSLLQDGFNCPEMIGENANQDATHWDTDCGTVKEGTENSIKNAIDNSLASGYGDSVTWVVLRDDERFTHTMPDDGNNYTDFTKYEAYHGLANGETFRGIRTGFAGTDVDFYVVRGTSKIMMLKNELAKNGCYVPIVDMETEEVIFTPTEYDRMRERLGGMELYGNVSYEGGERRTDLIEYKFANDLNLADSLSPENAPTFSELVAGYDEKERETRKLQEKVTADILSGIETSHLPEGIKRLFRNYRSNIGMDAMPGTVEALSTGSTSRFTNLPGDADFDFVWRLDRIVHQSYASEICNVLTEGDNPVITGGNMGAAGIRKGVLNIRMDDMSMPGEDRTIPVEIDISPTVKTDKVRFSSDRAAIMRLNAIRAQDPEKYKQVIANIVVAKELLSEAEVYKIGHGQDGIGGIGVENWIMQSGGSLRQAASEFLEAAKSNGNPGQYVDFDEFKSRYAVFDHGENHLSDSLYPYFNFIADSMNRGSFQKMCMVCEKVLAEG